MKLELLHIPTAYNRNSVQTNKQTLRLAWLKIKTWCLPRSRRALSRTYAGWHLPELLQPELLFRRFPSLAPPSLSWIFFFFFFFCPLCFLRSRVFNSFNDVLLLLDTTFDRASGKPKSVSETLNIHRDGEGRKGLLEGSFFLGSFQEVSIRLRDRYLVSTFNPGRQWKIETLVRDPCHE